MVVSAHCANGLAFSMRGGRKGVILFSSYPGLTQALCLRPRLQRSCKDRIVGLAAPRSDLPRCASTPREPPYDAKQENRMRALRSLCLIASPLLIAGCNTAPIPPGKPVDISTALQNVLQGLCDFRQDQATKKQDWGAHVESVTVELDLTVDGARTPPVAVAPDIQFIPTVSYGQILTSSRGSHLTLTLKPGSLPAECSGTNGSNGGKTTP
ncbi:hypothetical protein [Paraburkholderia sp. J94]|uniref:hypothetical protein n=1 Tax=Paraburkholderia sp. J94 TaxID=2805441 RepID=UPI0039F13042